MALGKVNKLGIIPNLTFIFKKMTVSCNWIGELARSFTKEYSCWSFLDTRDTKLKKAFFIKKSKPPITIY